MPTYADRVQETTATAGVGAVTLAGAVMGYQTFGNAFADQDIVYYCLADGTNWEVGQGVYNAGPNTLTRSTVVASSNAGAPVNFPGPSTNVFCTVPATGATGMVKASLATQSTNQQQNVIRIAQDDNSLFAQELVLNGTSEVWADGVSELVGYP